MTIIDDYAHHPQEIAATLAAAKNYPHREIWCVFQPHTYTRTKALMEDFAKALSTADHVVLADIYAARETDNLGISSGTLAEKIAALGTDTHYFPSFDAIETFLLENCVNGDLLLNIVTMDRAGDIVKVGEKPWTVSYPHYPQSFQQNPVEYPVDFLIYITVNLKMPESREK